MSKPVARAWVPALLWLAVIVVESSSLGSSQQTSRIIYPLLVFFFPHIAPAQLHLAHDALRKLGHIFGYAMLSLLMLRAWWTTLLLPRWAPTVPPLRAMLRSWSARAAALGLLSAAAVAAMDEWHQAALSVRTGSIRDVALDTMAAASAQLIAIAFSDARARHEAFSSQP